MATAFLSVMATVPWGKVVDNAPQFIDNARRLLLTLRGKAKIDELTLLDNEPGMNDLKLALEEQEMNIEALRIDLTQATEIILELTKSQARMIKVIRQLQIITIGIGILSTFTLLILMWKVILA